MNENKETHNFVLENLMEYNEKKINFYKETFKKKKMNLQRKKYIMDILLLKLIEG